jgi:hypothetical protein
MDDLPDRFPIIPHEPDGVDCYGCNVPVALGVCHWPILAVSRPVAASEWGMVAYKVAAAAVKIPAFSTEICTKTRTACSNASVNY